MIPHLIFLGIGIYISEYFKFDPWLVAFSMLPLVILSLRVKWISIPLSLTLGLFTGGVKEKEIPGEVVVGNIVGTTPRSSKVEIKYTRVGDSWFKVEEEIIVVPRIPAKEGDEVILKCKFKKNLCFAKMIEKTGHSKFSLRRRIRDTINSTTHDETTKSILSGIILGDFIPHDIRDKMAKLGVAHLLAISGLHFGMVAYFGLKIGRQIMLAAPKLTSVIEPLLFTSLVSLAIQTIYLLISGLKIPAIRAFTMFASLTLARILGRPRSSLPALVLSAYLILAFIPSSLFSLSFWLSFSAVFFIIYFYRPAGFLKDMFSISVISFLATFPILLSSGLPVGLLSPILNFIFIPIFAVAVFIGIIGALFQSALLFEFAGYPLKLARFLTDYLEPLALTFETKITIPLAFLSLLLVFLGLKNLGKRKIGGLLLALSFLVCLPQRGVTEVEKLGNMKVVIFHDEVAVFGYDQRFASKLRALTRGKSCVVFDEPKALPHITSKEKNFLSGCPKIDALMKIR